MEASRCADKTVKSALHVARAGDCCNFAGGDVNITINEEHHHYVTSTKQLAEEKRMSE